MTEVALVSAALAKGFGLPEYVALQMLRPLCGNRLNLPGTDRSLRYTKQNPAKDSIMSKVTYNGVYLRIELDHEETAKFTDTLTNGDVRAITAFLAALGVSAVVAPIVAAAVAVHLAWEIPATKAADKGDGVFLTAYGFPLNPAAFIPSTRYPHPQNDTWFSSDDGVIGSSEGDVIETHIEHGVIDPNAVAFRLNNQSPEGWDKRMILRDGNGAEYRIEAKGYASNENAIYVNEAANDAPLTFWKPKIFGIWTEIFSVRGIRNIPGGARVSFTWAQD